MQNMMKNGANFAINKDANFGTKKDTLKIVQ